MEANVNVKPEKNVGMTDNLPIDLTLGKNAGVLDGKSEKRPRKRAKKFEKLNLSEDAIDERRQTANTLERSRMKRMSQALEQLRQCIPQQYHLYHRRMSKIRTLRLATAYIKALSELIENDVQEPPVEYPCENNSHYQILQSPLLYQNVAINVVPTGADHSGTPTPFTTPYAGNLCQTPKRQLHFSPDTVVRQEPIFVTPGGHPAYQTPVGNFYQYQMSTKRGPHQHPVHTITCPADGEAISRGFDFQFSPLYKTTTQATGYSHRRKKSCRYEPGYEMEGIYPLPDDEKCGDNVPRDENT